MCWAQLEHHLVLYAKATCCTCRPSARSQKCSECPYFCPSSSSGFTPSSIIEGVPHSLVIAVLRRRCHQAS